MCYTRIFSYKYILYIEHSHPHLFLFPFCYFSVFFFLDSIPNSSGWPQMKLALTSDPLAYTSQVLEL